MPDLRSSTKRTTVIPKALAALGAVGLIGILWMTHSGPNGSAPKTEGLLLDDQTRNSIWEAERRGTLLGKLGFPRLIDAMARREPAAVSSELSSDFRARVPENSDARFESTRDGFRVGRETVSPSKETNANASEFLDWLFELRSQLPERIEAKFYTETIAPTIAGDQDGSWVGRFKLRLWGQTDQGQRAEIVIFSRIEFTKIEKSVFSAGGWIQRWLVESVTFGETDQRWFTDVARERGIDVASLYENWEMPEVRRAGNTGGAYLSDMNRDGWIDLLLTDIGHPDRIIFYFGEEGGRFREATEEVGLVTGRAGMAAFIDFDNDGWEDLIHVWRKYIAFREWEPESHPSGVRVYRNVAGRGFQEVTHSSNLPQLVASLERANPPTGFSIADYDRDGRADIYISRSAGKSKREGSWIDGKSGPESRNQLLRNVGDGLFVDVTPQIDGADGELRSSASAIWFDANNDLWPDLYIPDEFGDGLLLVNDQNGGFNKKKIVDQTHDWGTMGLIAGDYNNDGAIDLFVDNMYSKAGKRVMSNLPNTAYSDDVTRKLRRLVAGSELHQGVGDGTFQPVGKDKQVHGVGWSWGASFVDVDNDGFQDLYANAGYISQDRGKPDG